MYTKILRINNAHSNKTVGSLKSWDWRNVRALKFSQIIKK